MTRFILLAALLTLPVLASACNIMAGAGEDLSKGGQKLEKTTEENKHY